MIYHKKGISTIISHAPIFPIFYLTNTFCYYRQKSYSKPISKQVCQCFSQYAEKFLKKSFAIIQLTKTCILLIVFGEDAKPLIKITTPNTPFPDLIPPFYDGNSCIHVKPNSYLFHFLIRLFFFRPYRLVMTVSWPKNPKTQWKNESKCKIFKNESNSRFKKRNKNKKID